MADEVPQSPENTAENRSTPRDDASYDGGGPGPWAHPADRGPADTVPSSGTPGPPAWGAAPGVPLDKPVSGTGAEGPVPPTAHRSDPNPWAPPADDPPAARPGPGDTVFSGGAGTPPPPAVHDQRTITSFPNEPAPPAWANPFASPTPPAPGPFAPPTPASPAQNPFASPAAAGPHPQDVPVPPPPIAPDGPGQVPYGYPGGPAGYGYPAPHGAPAGYYGWPGMQPMPSNGMGTAGLVLGILAAITFCLWPVALVLGVLGVIFGGTGRGKARRGEATNPGQSLAGIICGSAGIVLALVMLAFEIANAT
ncbi:hypothetical protein ABZ864_37365 [Streptomyces sp. NPDC047082]|uniref:hypothetical protein n=1 Tax=Streptomyces sp. NPDC047082 TaxID=3155259 RepID=UPI003408F7D5